MTKREQTTYVSIRRAANRAGVETRVVRHCVEVGVVNEALTEADLAELRRARRLMSLGVNLPGVEIILWMRRQIEDLQGRVAQLKAQLRS